VIAFVAVAEGCGLTQWPLWLSLDARASVAVA